MLASIRPLRTLTLSAVVGLGSLSAHAATIALKAQLSSASEVPAKDSKGTGQVTATLDTDTYELKYHVVYSGLTGPAVAAHFHGPAAEGVNASHRFR